MTNQYSSKLSRSSKQGKSETRMGHKKGKGAVGTCPRGAHMSGWGHQGRLTGAGRAGWQTRRQGRVCVEALSMQERRDRERVPRVKARVGLSSRRCWKPLKGFVLVLVLFLLLSVKYGFCFVSFCFNSSTVNVPCGISFRGAIQ